MSADGVNGSVAENAGDNQAAKACASLVLPDPAKPEAIRKRLESRLAKKRWASAGSMRSSAESASALNCLTISERLIVPETPAAADADAVAAAASDSVCVCGGRSLRDYHPLRNR